MFGVLGFQYGSGSATADISKIQVMSDALTNMFTISPLLLLPPVIVIVAVAMKMPAIPGITLGILTGVLLGIFLQPTASLGAFLDAGMNGFESNSGVSAVDALLTSGGLMKMMFSISLTLLAMMFGGIMEATHQLEVLVNQLLRFVKGGPSLIFMTLFTCVLSNASMPEQYISIVIPGRMYAETYKKAQLHPKTLSNALESSGTVTSALIPWNTCGVFITQTLGIGTLVYMPWAIFNWSMPVITFLLAFVGVTLADANGNRILTAAGRKQIKENLKNNISTVENVSKPVDVKEL